MPSRNAAGWPCYVVVSMLDRPPPLVPAPESSSPPLHVLESDRPLSQSMLWRLQRTFYEQHAIDAWREASLPHHITCNPALARSVAEVVVAFVRDGLATGRVDPAKPVYIVELGAGTGRFGFLFLKALLMLRAPGGLAALDLRYVMTDFAAANLALWRASPALAPFFADRVLDAALFDAEHDDRLVLGASGAEIGPGSLENPVVVLANYVLDAISQDAFRIEHGRLHEVLISVGTTEPDVDLARADALTALRFGYRHEPIAVASEPYAESELSAILADYAATLGDTTLLFPTTALRALRRLAALSRRGMLLVSGDKGSTTASELADRDDPGFVVHKGCFSLSVNYHAIAEWFRRAGGVALTSDRCGLSLHVLAGVLGVPSGELGETRLAYERGFARASYDDLFHITCALRDRADSLRIGELLSAIRLSDDDPHLLRDCLQALTAQLPTASAGQRDELAGAVERAWSSYFHIGEAMDLAFELAVFLALLDRPAPALRLFGESLRLFGDDPRTFWNIALCQLQLGRHDEASESLSRAWRIDPTFRPDASLVMK